MPTTFVCNDCALRFSAGWYHYHRFDSGYCGRTLLVCTECGTQHALEWALPDRGPPFHTFHRFIVESVPADAQQHVCQILRRQRRIKISEAIAIVRNPPFVILEEVLEAAAAKVRDKLVALGVSLRTEFVKLRPNPNFGPVQRDRLLYHAVPMFRKTTEEWAAWNGALAQCEEPEALVQTLTCQHCHVPGKLTSEIDQTHACPSCKERELVAESSWIT